MSVDIDDSMIGKIFTGSQFNKIFKGVKFVKLTNANEIHNSYQFKDGLNIDNIPFKPIGECEPGGIYFIIDSEIKKWIYYSQQVMTHVRIVNIPNSAKVYVEDGKFKADKLILGEKKIITIAMYREGFYYNMKYDPNNALSYIPTYAINRTMCMYSIKKSIVSLRFV